MKHLLTLLLIFCSFLAISQTGEIKPLTAKNATLTPNNASIWFNQLDSIPGISMGTYGYVNLVTKEYKRKYLVPYIGAIKNVNLGLYAITAYGQRLPLSNGSCQISTLTDNGNGSVTLGSGDYHLASEITGHDSKIYSLTGGTFTLIDQSQNYIVADYNSGTPIIKVITDVTLINETTIVPIYSIFRGGNILHIQDWDALGLALSNKIHQSIVKTQRYRRESGLALSEYGTHNLNLSVGRIWTGAVPITLDEIATATDNLFFFRHVGGTWSSTVQPTYNFTQYDNGTNLVTLTNNRYAVNWVFRGVESQKHLYIVIGTGDYSEPQAISATLPAIPVAISSHAVLVAKLIVQKNAATATSIQSAFDTQFGLSAIQAHGDLTGRDVVDSHPSGAITNTPSGTITATDVQTAINQLDAKKEPVLTKGNLVSGTASVTITNGNDRLVGGDTATITVNFPTALPTPNALTMNNSGTGDASGSTFTGSAAKTISYNTIGAAPSSGSGSYIQNQNASAQSANMWISGSISNSGNIKLVVDNAQSYFIYPTNLGGLYTRFGGAIKIKSDGGSINRYLQLGMVFNDSPDPSAAFMPSLTINSDLSATFASTINSTGYLLNGNNLHSSLTANKITQWDGTKFTPITDGTNGQVLTTNGSGVYSWVTNSSSWPGFGTSHATAAYGDHNHSGVYQPAGSYDNYGGWVIEFNGEWYNNRTIASGQFFRINNGSGISFIQSNVSDGVTLTGALDIYGLTTIVNPSLSGFLPYTTTGTNVKITLSTLQTTIGSTAGTANLNVIRDGSGDAYAHNFILSSDRKLKKNIIDLPNTDWTNKIQFKQFQFKDDPKEKIRFGVIAQDIEKIAPELVSTDENGMKAVSYIDMLIAKVAEMDKKIKELEENQFLLNGQLELLKMKNNEK